MSAVRFADRRTDPLLRQRVQQEFGDVDFWSVFEAQASRHAGRTFFIWQPFDRTSIDYSYAEVAQRARALAAGLQARGVGAGDPILIHLENSPEFLIAWLACTALGAIAVTTNTRSAEDELRYYAADCGAVAAITQPKFAARLAVAAPQLAWMACTDHDAGVPACPGAGCLRFDALSGDPTLLRPRATDALAAAIVQYTSGTTARPKGVVWTHANLLWAARSNARNQDLRGSDCHLVYLPLFHANAMTFGVLPCLWTGAHFLLTPKWSTSRFWALSLQHGCTWLSLIGLSIRALLSQPAPPTHRYRQFGTGFSLDEFPGHGVKTIGWWGMTETVAMGIVGSTHEPNRAMAVGKPSPDYQLRLLRSDGLETADEEAGELWIKGVPGLSLFAGYLGKPEVTAAAFDAEGWFQTGDLLIRHADGSYSFVDRGKDMLRVGAENVAASEVERVIQTVPGVLEAAVVSRPDPKLDEVPVAFVRTRYPGDEGVEDQVLKTCRDMLADFKVPRAVYVVAEMPRSTISKVNKVALRAVAAPDADRRAAEQQWLAAACADPSGDQG